MTTEEMRSIDDLLQQGLGYRKIAVVTGLPANTVKTYCRRHNLAVSPPAKERAFCKTCGKPIVRIPQHRQRLYCSDACRMKYWNSHRSEVKHKNTYTFRCPSCGEEFTSAGNPNRKYCSRKCADKAKRKGDHDER